jgi:hypothetical protein
MIVFNPVARPKETVRKIEKITSLEGKVLGLLNNRWPSWEALLNKMETILIEKYKVKEVKILPIPLASAAPEELIEETARVYDMCVVGLGN